MSIKKKTTKKVAKRKVSKKVFKDSRELSEWHLDILKKYFENKAIEAFRDLSSDDKLGIKIASPSLVKMINDMAENSTREIAQSVMWQIAKEEITK